MRTSVRIKRDLVYLFIVLLAGRTRIRATRAGRHRQRSQRWPAIDRPNRLE
ncbi:hypothetical protein BN903_157 [Halorubrum sp. AJ67]|nr:hypothetical protein BN903_157 [Halorubrum sp. AJ67]